MASFSEEPVGQVFYLQISSIENVSFWWLQDLRPFILSGSSSMDYSYFLHVITINEKDIGWRRSTRKTEESDRQSEGPFLVSRGSVHSKMEEKE